MYNLTYMFAMFYVFIDLIYLASTIEIYYIFSHKNGTLLLIYHGFHKQKYVNYTLYFTLLENNLSYCGKYLCSTVFAEQNIVWIFQYKTH